MTVSTLGKLKRLGMVSGNTSLKEAKLPQGKSTQPDKIAKIHLPHKRREEKLVWQKEEEKLLKKTKQPFLPMFHFQWQWKF